MMFWFVEQVEEVEEVEEAQQWGEMKTSVSKRQENLIYMWNWEGISDQ